MTKKKQPEKNEKAAQQQHEKKTLEIDKESVELDEEALDGAVGGAAPPSAGQLYACEDAPS